MSKPPISNLLSVPSPLPAKKSTMLGAGGVMKSFGKVEGGYQRGFLEAGEEWILKCET
jgi:hypothetical protein